MTARPVRLSLRSATNEDLAPIARMNRQLILDEGSRNRMSVPELEARLRDWLDGNWRIDVVRADGVVVGYAVYQIRTDEYDSALSVVYLRQMFVDREHRGHGIGSAVVELLASERFPAGSKVVIDVLETNPGGRRFWERAGFRPYSTIMERSS